MTKSIYLQFGDYATPIVVNGIYDPEGEGHQLQHGPCEVVIFNSSNNGLYLGDQFCYDSGNGILVSSGTGITLSLGSGDMLFGYSDGYIELPVMILSGKRR